MYIIYTKTYDLYGKSRSCYRPLYLTYYTLAWVRSRVEDAQNRLRLMGAALFWHLGLGKLQL